MLSPQELYIVILMFLYLIFLLKYSQSIPAVYTKITISSKLFFQNYVSSMSRRLVSPSEVHECRVASIHSHVTATATTRTGVIMRSTVEREEVGRPK